MVRRRDGDHAGSREPETEAVGDDTRQALLQWLPTPDSEEGEKTPPSKQLFFGEELHALARRLGPTDRQAAHDFFIDHSDHQTRACEFLQTDGEYLGLGPVGTGAGDKMCVLAGINMPFVMRPRGECCELVGPGFLLGFVGGEAVDLVEKGKFQRESIRIQ